MKQIVSVFRAALLIAVLALLAACSGSFIDPGHVDGLVSMGDGDYSGGGFDWDFDFDLDNDDDGDGDETSGSKPSKLSGSANYSQANAKLDEIIAYCNAHPGPANDAAKGYAEVQKTTNSSYQSTGMWTTMRSAVIISINTYIDGLQ